MLDKESWIAHILSCHSKKIDYDLPKLELLAKVHGLDKFNAKVIVVGGTNGKGSVCGLLERLLVKAGYAVGVYTSPEMFSINERIRLNGNNISDQDLLSAFAYIEGIRATTPLTFFEFMTMAALYHFSLHKLDYMVLEIGMGGRKDAVNLVRRDVAIITSLGIDHQEYLGDTIESIAYEKVFIFKEYAKAITTVKSMPASMAKYISDNKIQLQQLDKDFSYIIQDGKLSWQSKQLTLVDIKLPNVDPLALAGAIAVLAQLNCYELLQTHTINQYLAGFNIFGRFTKIQSNCQIILDVAHNQSSISNLHAKLISINTSKKYAIFAMRNTKDLDYALSKCKHLFEHWFIITLADASLFKQEEYERVLSAKQIDNYSFIDNSAALKLVLANTASNHLMVAFGSFITVKFVAKCLAIKSSNNFPECYNKH